MDAFNEAKELFNANGSQITGDALNERVEGLSQSQINYFNNTKNGAATTQDYTDSVNNLNKGFLRATIGSKALSIGIKAVNTVANIGIMMLVSSGISLVINAISNAIHKTENLIKAGKEASQSIKEINSTYSSHQKTVDEVGKRYDELSKGVEQSGSLLKNKSLSGGEYNEFLDISNQLASIFPSIVSGFDSNGNAILSLGTNAKTASTQLQELLEAERKMANYKIAEKLPTVFEGAKAQEDESAKTIQKLKSSFDQNITEIKNYNALTKSIQSEDYTLSIASDPEITMKLREGLETQNIKYTEETIQDLGPNSYGNQSTIHTFSLNSSTTQKDKENLANYLDTRNYDYLNSLAFKNKELLFAINVEQQKTQQEWAALVPDMMSYLQTSDEFNQLSETTISAVNSSLLSGSLSSIEDGTNIKDFLLKNYLIPLTGSTPAIRKAYEDLFNLDIDKKDLSIKEWTDKREKLLKTISQNTGQSVAELKITYGYVYQDKDGRHGKVSEKLDDVANTLGDTSKTFRSKLKDLSGEEFDLLYDLVIHEQFKGNFEEIQAEIQKRKDSIQTLITKEDLVIQTQEVTTGYDTITEALKQIQTAGYITKDTIQALEDSFGDFGNMEDFFFNTSTGMQVNADSLLSLADAANETTKAQLETNKALASNSYSNKLKELNEELGNQNNQYKSLEEQEEAIEKHRSQLSGNNLIKFDDLVSDITNLKLTLDTYVDLENQINATTSSLTRYHRALNTPNEHDNYDSSKSGLDNAKNLKSRGWISQDDYTSYMDYIGYTNPEGKENGLDNYDRDADAVLARAERYFTYNESGETTNDGVYNFMNDIIAKSQKDNIPLGLTYNGETYNWDDNFDIDNVAKEMDMTTSMVTDLVLAAMDAGQEIDFQKIVSDITDEINQLESGKDGDSENSIGLNVNKEDIDEAKEKFAELQEKKDKLQKNEHSSTFSSESKDNLESEIKTLEDELYSESPEILLELGLVTEDSLTEGYQAVDALQQQLGYIDGLEASPSVNPEEIENAKTKLYDIANSMLNLSPEIKAHLGIEGLSTEEIVQKLSKDPITIPTKIQQITNPFLSNGNNDSDTQITLTPIINTPEVITNFKSIWDSLRSKTITITTIKKEVTPGVFNWVPPQSGIAQYRGNVGAQENGQVLLNELGKELIVRNGSWFTVNNGYPAFTDLKKGDLVFNHTQTKTLFERGYLSGSHAQQYGTALSNGNIDILKNRVGVGVIGSGKDYSSNNSTYEKNEPSNSNPKPNTQQREQRSSNNEAKSENQEAKTFDFVEIKLKRLAKSFEDLTDKLDQCTLKYREQNDIIDTIIVNGSKRINSLTKAKTSYEAEAANVGLDSRYITKIKEGDLSIEQITDKDTKEKIDDYKTWYEKALDVKNTISDLKQELKELHLQKMDNIKSYFNNVSQYYDNAISVNDQLMDLANAQGKNISENLYKNSIYNLNQKRGYLNGEKLKLQAEFNSLRHNGTIAYESEEWYEWQEVLKKVNEEIIKVDTDILELRTDILELRWSKFDEGIKKLEDMGDYLSGLGDLIKDTMTFSADSSAISGLGYGKLGLLTKEMMDAKQGLADYALQLQVVQKQYKAGAMSQKEYLDRTSELKDGQLDFAKSLQSVKDSMLKLIKEGIKKQTDAMEDYISIQKKSLDRKKEADNYEKDIHKKTKSIYAIKAKIAAMSGDNSDDNQAKLRKLKAQLADSEEELQETKDKRSETLQKESYDDFLSDFKKSQDKQVEILESSMQAQDTAIANLLKDVFDNQDIVISELTNLFKSFGITLPNEIAKIFDSPGQNNQGNFNQTQYDKATAGIDKYKGQMVVQLLELEVEQIKSLAAKKA